MATPIAEKRLAYYILCEEKKKGCCVSKCKDCEHGYGENSNDN